VSGDPATIEGGTAVKETTVPVAQAVTEQEGVLPASGCARAAGGGGEGGLLALSVGVGLGVLAN
jgi:hypothetical protein